jgi:hypothetical protein
MEIPLADKAPIQPARFLPAPTNHLGTTSRSRSGTATHQGQEGCAQFHAQIEQTAGDHHAP